MPVAAAKSLRAGPMPIEQTLTPSISDLGRLVEHASDFPDAGYALLDGPTAYAQSRVVMPGVTTAMFEWWFTWHPLERERYMLWFPQAHIDNSVVNPTRLADPSLSYAERLYDNPNAIDEFIGPTSLKIVIHFAPPASLGLDEQTDGCYLDGDRFAPLWERAEALDAPIYLHAADAAVMPVTYAGRPELDGAAWSWTAETAAHTLRIIFGGVFSRFPKAKLLLGHMGETLPYLLWRLDKRVQALVFHALQPASLLLLASISTAPLVAISTAWAGPDEHPSLETRQIMPTAYSLDQRLLRQAWKQRTAP